MSCHIRLSSFFAISATIVALVLSGCGGSSGSPSFAVPATSVTVANLVQRENSRPGTAGWEIPAGAGTVVTGCASETSVAPGRRPGASSSGIAAAPGERADNDRDAGESHPPGGRPTRRVLPVLWISGRSQGGLTKATSRLRSLWPTRRGCPAQPIARRDDVEHRPRSQA
jgi:hypothetical protein